MREDGKNEPQNVPEKGLTQFPQTAAAEADDQVWVIEDETAAASGPAVEERLRSELAEVREQWVRTVADLDNYRKRSEREAREVKRFALFEPMRDLVAVVDNLERALSAGGSVEDLKRGVEMILLQLKDVMKMYGVKEVPALGTSFDPAVHDAVARFESPTAEVPTVAEELQRGYAMHDRLLRPALVKVAMPPADAASAAVRQAPNGEESA